MSELKSVILKCNYYFYDVFSGVRHYLKGTEFNVDYKTSTNDDFMVRDPNNNLINLGPDIKDYDILELKYIEHDITYLQELLNKLDNE